MDRTMLHSIFLHVHLKQHTSTMESTGNFWKNTSNSQQMGQWIIPPVPDYLVKTAMWIFHSSMQPIITWCTIAKMFNKDLLTVIISCLFTSANVPYLVNFYEYIASVKNRYIHFNTKKRFKHTHTHTNHIFTQFGHSCGRIPSYTFVSST